MLVLGMAFIFAGYSVGGFGWVLIRGYNITFRSWMSPLNPYQWPAGGPGLIPDQQLFPSLAAGEGSAGPALSAPGMGGGTVATAAPAGKGKSKPAPAPAPAPAPGGGITLV